MVAVKAIMPAAPGKNSQFFHGRPNVFAIREHGLSSESGKSSRYWHLKLPKMTRPMKSPRYGSGIIAVWPVGKETSWSYETTRLLAMPPLKIFHEANQLLNLP